jgi:hypothetical protein
MEEEILEPSEDAPVEEGTSDLPESESEETE